MTDAKHEAQGCAITHPLDWLGEGGKFSQRSPDGM